MPRALRIPPVIVIALRDNVLVATYALLLSNLYFDNSGSDSRNLIGQLQVSKRGRNLERDS